MRTVFLVVTLLMLSGCLDGRADVIATSWRNDIAVQGWDIVSFYQGEPQRGDADFVQEYAGAEWRFATQANRDVFAFNPEAFQPEYGGYCAWALGHNKLARGNPEYWTMLDGKLYFNFNDRTDRLWTLGREGWIARANAFWPGVLG